MKIEFTVYGEAKTAGSKRAFYNPKLKRSMIVDANPNARDWKEQVASAARQAYSGPILRQPLLMRLTFFRVRPKGHFKSDGSLSKEGRDAWIPSTRPDLLKLARAVEDALQGVIYSDDAQIVSEALFKEWGSNARLEVVIHEISSL